MENIITTTKKVKSLQYRTRCPVCETEEKFISTSTEHTCGKCGSETNVIESSLVGYEPRPIN